MKKIWILPIFFLINLLFVYGAPSISLLTTTWNNGTMVNISITDASNVTALTVYAYSSRTANTSSNAVLVNITNTTATPISNGTYANFTFGVEQLEDSNDYSIAFKTTADGGGSADGATGTTATNVVVDRTAPTAPTSVTFTNPVKDTDTISATVSGALTTRCYIRFGGQNVERRAMTHSGNTCTFTVGKNNPPNNDYQTFIEATDETNISFSTVQNVVIRAVTSDGGGLFGGTLIKSPESGGVSMSGIGTKPFSVTNDKAILGLVLIILVYLYYKNKR